MISHTSCFCSAIKTTKNRCLKKVLLIFQIPFLLQLNLERKQHDFHHVDNQHYYKRRPKIYFKQHPFSLGEQGS